MKALKMHREGRIIQDPPIARFLFADTRAAWLWLVLRIYVGYQWVEAGLHKITGTGWVDGGAALKGFWEKGVAIPATGNPVISIGWYRDFINMLLGAQSYTWFAPLIAYGEFLVGVGLIVGAFVGIAAFFGGFMNWNFIMAGSASVNGFLLVLTVFLVLAWKIAGYIGLDRWLLPILGTPWKSKAAAPAAPPVPATN